MDDSPADRAAHEELRYIRRTLEAAGHLSTIPGRGMVGIGVLALAATAANLYGTGAPWSTAQPERALLVWAALLAASMCVGVWAMARKAQRSGQIFWSPVLRRALWGYGAAMLLGGILTASALLAGRLDRLPEIWLGCYGAALCSAGVVSVSPVRWMGACFLILAGAAVLTPPQNGLLLLGLGFGWLHIAFGAYIAWRHNG